jgi:transposase InsO family protein
LKLLDGTRAYLHAVIDNFSRKILAWKLAARLEPASTCEVLAEAGRAAGLIPPVTVLADSGGENVNARVDALIEAGLIKRVLAQVEVSFSNSMIEAFWRSLRHQWLYLHDLTDLPRVRTLVAFYVQQHNQVMPHAAFQGQTPDEMFFGTGADLPAELAAAHRRARAARIEANRALSCGVCRRIDAPG